ncbi:hypothetical protein Ahy_A02g006321 [Arachis hypogaea]|uniref:DUF3700 domain-containing protein n=1 Tax=Arachis hypogaea TaxID=3818 RepID=A0A445EA23_ARAHY|nr:hypothetical protein Ahy_A02g006321 [Arachis hypogaea]
MAAASSVAGWSSFLCVAHGCSVLFRSSALPIASPRPALPHRASGALFRIAAPRLRFAVWTGSATTEAYRTLRDRGPYPAAQVVRDFQSKFAVYSWLVPIDLLQLKGILDSDLVPLKLRYIVLNTYL